MNHKPETYRNAHKSEYIHVGKVYPPCKFVGDKIIYAKRNKQGTGWVWE